MIAIAMPVLVTNAIFSVPEFVVTDVKKDKLSLKKSLSYVWKNDPYRRLVIAFLFSTIGAAMTNTLSFFFVKHVLLAGELFGFYLAPYFLS